MESCDCMNIELINGDCLEEMRKIPDGSIDLIVTSPPYWKGFEYEAYFNSYAQYLRWCEKWLKEAKRVLKPNGNFYLNVINDSEITKRAYEIMDIATEHLMYKLHDTIIWYRYNQQPANTSRQLTNQQEFIFHLRHTSANVKYNKEDAYKAYPDAFDTKNVGNVWRIPFKSGKKTTFGRKETGSKGWGHGGFPDSVAGIPIILSSSEGDTVLDMFMGSGTTGVVCKNLNRTFIGIELDKDYYEIAKKRIEDTPEPQN